MYGYSLRRKRSEVKVRDRCSPAQGPLIGAKLLGAVRSQSDKEGPKWHSPSSSSTKTVVGRPADAPHRHTELESRRHDSAGTRQGSARRRGPSGPGREVSASGRARLALARRRLHSGPPSPAVMRRAGRYRSRWKTCSVPASGQFASASTPTMRRRASRRAT